MMLAVADKRPLSLPDSTDSVQLPLEPDSIKGFLGHDEGEALYLAALEASTLGPCVEIGSYCGKSTLYIGTACKERDNTLFAVDHHSGSEEHQQGEEYFDAEIFDQQQQRVDSFPFLRQVLAAAGLTEHVVPVVAASAVVARHWRTPLGMVFIDGGHSLESARSDYRHWSSWIISGGILAIHDIFPDPSQGGQAPYMIMQSALASGLFVEYRSIDSLVLLKRQ